MALRRRTRVKENFAGTNYTLTDSQTNANGKLRCAYAGGGTVETKFDDVRTSCKVMRMVPEVPVPETGTRACRVETTTHVYDFEATVDIKTVAHTRTTPNNWEVAWLMFHYTVTNHHYSFLIQKNGGCELSKKDFAEVIEQQVFLQTTNDTSPTWSLGQWFHVKVRMVGYLIKIWVDGVLRINITDSDQVGTLNGQPYNTPPTEDMRHGMFCFYTEDADTHFANFAMRAL